MNSFRVIVIAVALASASATAHAGRSARAIETELLPPLGTEIAQSMPMRRSLPVRSLGHAELDVMLEGGAMTASTFTSPGLDTWTRTVLTRPPAGPKRPVKPKETTIVPLPAPFALALVGLGGVLIGRRRIVG